ncbi:MAG: hypothetical protein GXY42_00980 [Desulfovibrionales bacterium]|nr:hypothetical protein [Desulfovibrionales bacterium]
MSRDFRVYGHLTGLDESQIRACTTVFSGYECEARGHVLDFVHEGPFLDLDSDLEAMLAILGPDARGIIDVINHQDWEMHRYTLANGLLTRTRIDLDNALDTAYASERRS